MTRAFFLYLSQQPGLRRWLEQSSFGNKITRRFIAGVTLEDELAVCSDFAQRNIFTTADHLGENVTELRDAEVALDAYLEAMETIAARKLPTSLSLKLTALGLDLSEPAAVAHLRKLATRAAELNAAGHSHMRIEIDMEDTRYTETTVRIAETIGQETGCIRVAIQAYLYRTPDDIDRLNRARVMVRLCKGAYIEPPSQAMPAKSDVDQAYLKLMRTLLDAGTYPALATHDEKMIGPILEHVKQRNLAPEQYEFEMLHGVRRDLQQSLTDRGHRVRVYVPYGDQWYRYFMRRLAERPANVWFVVKNLLR